MRKYSLNSVCLTHTNRSYVRSATCSEVFTVLPTVKIGGRTEKFFKYSSILCKESTKWNRYKWSPFITILPKRMQFIFFAMLYLIFWRPRKVAQAAAKFLISIWDFPPLNLGCHTHHPHADINHFSVSTSKYRQRISKNRTRIHYHPVIRGNAVAQLVEALRYKPENRGIDSRYQWRTEGGLGGSNPPPEIPKFWQSTKN
jgi:hypothetical protein